jgi:D-3-phosphoglycerate dehydrogenase
MQARVNETTITKQTMINKQETFIFDFDSTFIKVEVHAVLCEIIYANNSARKHVLA